MNELPDLPGVPRRTRPVPADGLQQAIRIGRRRRALFLGTTGGAGLVAIVLTAIALQPGVGRQSLDVADLDTSPTPVVTASTLPGQRGAGRPAAEPTEQPAPPAATSSAESPGTPAPDSSASTAPGPAYTETAQDEAAPLECVAPPSGHTGPVYYGGASACASSSGGASHVKRGGSVRATTSLCSPYRGGNVVLGFDTGREHDVRVYDGAGDLVYQFSKTVRYTEGAHQLTVADGRCAVWTGVWDTTLTDGRLAPAGSYRVQVRVHADSVDGRRTSLDEGASSEFSVGVS